MKGLKTLAAALLLGGSAMAMAANDGQARVNGSITRQISDRNTFSIRPNYQYEDDENRGQPRGLRQVAGPVAELV